MPAPSKATSDPDALRTIKNVASVVLDDECPWFVKIFSSPDRLARRVVDIIAKNSPTSVITEREHQRLLDADEALETVRTGKILEFLSEIVVEMGPVYAPATPRLHDVGRALVALHDMRALDAAFAAVEKAHGADSARELAREWNGVVAHQLV